MMMMMGENWELIDGKKREWDLNFRWEWDWNGNEVIEMGGNLDKKSVPTHLKFVYAHDSEMPSVIVFVTEQICR